MPHSSTHADLLFAVLSDERTECPEQIRQAAMAFRHLLESEQGWTDHLRREADLLRPWMKLRESALLRLPPEVVSRLIRRLREFALAYQEEVEGQRDSEESAIHIEPTIHPSK